ncbi:MAG: 3-hydroxybutyrate dehydrogenase [Alphaproteobacteria bacterium]|nr:3-hydroxybutyrate dehydrogenase [Alphaproteobacteria bacterium]
MSLKGKVGVVTGSTSGIGLGIARALAGAGADVMLNGLGDASEIEKIRAGIETDFGVKALYHSADMTKPGEIDDMIQAAQAKLGSADILVNNAGIQHVAPVEEFPPEKWEAVIAINLSAPFYAIRAAVPGMKKKNWGRIINIASAHGLVASVNKAAYISAKHGLVGLTKTVALELATTGVTVNAICPGWVRTPLVEAQIVARAKAGDIEIEESGRRLLAEKQPSLRFTMPEQLGALAVFLCSEAASNMTGTSLPMDGGWTAQ